MAAISGIPPDAAGRPIRLPGSAFWNVFKTFGRDEAIALCISTASTLAVSFFTDKVMVLALAGPIVEKIGFYPWHVWEAARLYRAAAPAQRRPLSAYIKEALAAVPRACCGTCACTIRLTSS